MRVSWRWNEWWAEGVMQEVGERRAEWRRRERRREVTRGKGWDLRTEGEKDVRVFIVVEVIREAVVRVVEGEV